jgi:hypothetical protein
VTSSRRAADLGAGDIVPFDSGNTNALDVASFYVVASADGAGLNVALVEI